MSIVSPEPDSNTPDPHTLCGIAHAMTRSTDPFTQEVAALIGYIGSQHEPPVTCHECRDDRRDAMYPCLTQDAATSIAFAWLLRVIEERG